MSRECVMAGSTARERMEQDVGSNVGTIVAPRRSIQLVDCPVYQEDGRYRSVLHCSDRWSRGILTRQLPHVDGYHISLTVNLDAIGAIGTQLT